MSNAIRKALLLASTSIILLVAAMGATLMDGDKEVEIPDPPELSLPEPLLLPEPTSTLSGVTIDVSESITGNRYENCTLVIHGKEGLKISRCEFVNTRILISEARDIELSENRIKDYYVHEDAAVRAQNVESLLMSHNEVENNSIGLVVGGGSDIEIHGNLFVANDQHNAISGLDCRGAEIHGNLFRFNFPHAILAMNRESDPQVQVSIHDNLFDRNLEDAVNFEDFGGSTRTSRVYNNRINGTGWAGINVEYNSWDANIVVEGNYIDGNGLLTEDALDGEGRPTSCYPAHRHQPEPYSPGWGHGVKLEDCSGVTLKENIIVSNVGNGVDVCNARGVTLEGNTIALNEIGLSVRGFQESSMSREYSPISPEDAGVSVVTDRGNTFADNVEEDTFVEGGSQLITED